MNNLQTKSICTKAKKVSVFRLFVPEQRIPLETVNSQEGATLDKNVDIEPNEWMALGIFIDRVFNVVIAFFMLVYSFLCFPEFY